MRFRTTDVWLRTWLAGLATTALVISACGAAPTRSEAASDTASPVDAPRADSGGDDVATVVNGSDRSTDDSPHDGDEDDERTEGELPTRRDRNRGQPAERVRGSGVVVGELRALGPFTSIDLQGGGRVEVNQDLPSTLEIVIDDNLAPLLDTVNEDGALVIRSATGYTLAPSTEPVYRVGCQALSSVRVSGSGSVHARGCSGDSLQAEVPGSGAILIEDVEVGSVGVTINGAGRVELHGRSASQQVRISGAGHYNGSQLETSSAHVIIDGSGHTTVWASTSLSVDISGSGSVAYRDNPAVDRHIAGSGTVSKLDH